MEYLLHLIKGMPVNLVSHVVSFPLLLIIKVKYILHLLSLVSSERDPVINVNPKCFLLVQLILYETRRPKESISTNHVMTSHSKNKQSNVLFHLL